MANFPKPNLTGTLKNKYLALLQVSQMWHLISPSEKKLYIASYRNTVNQYMLTLQDTAKTRSAEEFYYEFNYLVDTFNDKTPFKVQPLDRISPEELSGQIHQMQKKLNIRAEDEVKKKEAEIDYFNELKDRYEKKDFSRRRRRVTLLDLGGESFRKAQKSIMYKIEQGMNKGLQWNKISKDVYGELLSVFPDDTIPIITETGVRNYPLKAYSEGWVFDMQSQARTQANDTYMTKAGVELYIIMGGITDNPICDPYSRPSNNIYARNAEAARKYGVRMGEFDPPFHPNCSKYKLPYIQGVNYDNLSYRY